MRASYKGRKLNYKEGSTQVVKEKIAKGADYEKNVRKKNRFKKRSPWELGLKPKKCEWIHYELETCHKKVWQEKGVNIPCKFGREGVTPCSGIRVFTIPRQRGGRVCVTGGGRG